MLCQRVIAFSMLLFSTTLSWSQAKLSTHWEELTASDFREGIRRSQGTCLLPFGILEKHGPHLPLGTDLLDVRYAALHAADQQLALLQETTDEMARNGCKKVLIVNGHGGNEHLLPFFAQSQLERPRDYVVYVLGSVEPPPGGPPHKSTAINWHAGESETSHMMISRPDLVHIDRASDESGADQKRLNLPENVYTGIWWYARFPYHYSGEGALATHELGEYDMKAWVSGIVNAIRAVKADQNSLKLQNQFYEKSKRPLDTQP